MENSLWDLPSFLLNDDGTGNQLQCRMQSGLPVSNGLLK
jgi:hypothetical protein